MIPAMIFCRQHGYELVQIESQEELDLLQAQLLKLGKFSMLNKFDNIHKCNNNNYIIIRKSGYCYT
jgi:hypothetical protein